MKNSNSIGSDENIGSGYMHQDGSRGGAMM